MAQQLGDNVNFRPKFADKNHIKEMHDGIVEIFNMKRDVIKYKSFMDNVGKCKKWEYADGNYSVISPLSPNDLANEGFVLHHCVKSYIGKVSEGHTNIMFIRKAEELDVPFFTVEISNSGAIEQIHGFSNRNLETEPDLVPFVKAWIKERKLSRQNFNKVR